MNDLERMTELKGQGFKCSQIMVQMGLDLQGKTNPDLIKAARGLAGGLGFSGRVCGALSGGACFLGLYAGQSDPERQDDPRLDPLVGELVDWFEETYGQIDCEALLDGNMNNSPQRCPAFVVGTYQKVKEILVENGYELSGADDND